jgi:phosphoribosylglycinamide formyltransferase 1
LTTGIGVISSGRGENLRYILEAIRSGYLPAEVRIVLTDQPMAGALGIAEEYKVKALFLDPAGLGREEYDKILLRHLEEENVELVILTGYLRILSPAFVAKYKNRVLNIHPALLPAFRGMNAFKQALDHGAKWTGTTVHLVDDEVDHGPIVYQVPVKIKEDDTYESLKSRVQRAEYRAYPKAIKMFIEGRPRLEGRKLVFDLRE